MYAERKLSLSGVIGACALAWLALAVVPPASGAQRAKQVVPSVDSLGVPTYPRVAWVAHIEGQVRLKVRTDGRQVAGSVVEGGNPILARAAQENVATWRFKAAAPATFEVTYRYTVLPQSKCEPGGPTVTLRLPEEVDVVVEGLMLCDPVEETGP